MRKRLLSFKYAFKGLAALASSEPNFQIHIAAAAIVVFLGFWLEISAVEWCLALLCFAAVLAAEALNSAVEKLTDIVSPGHDPRAGLVKDMAAGGVLAAAIMAAVVGALIFVPKLLRAF
jgi:diacylglycerol kinase (ATP)